MRIVVDDKIPYIQGALEPFAEVVYLPGSKTTAEVVKDATRLLPGPEPSAMNPYFPDQKLKSSPQQRSDTTISIQIIAKKRG